MKKKEQHEHLKAFSLEEILPYIGIKNKKTITLLYKEKEEKIKANTPSLYLFKNKRICVDCGRIGNIFYLVRQKNGTRRPLQLNLYYYNPEKENNMILMTRDHIIPLDMGGLNTRLNAQCMCEECNHKKDNILRNDDIKRLNNKGGRRLIKRTIKNGGKLKIKV